MEKSAYSGGLAFSLRSNPTHPNMRFFAESKIKDRRSAPAPKNSATLGTTQLHGHILTQAVLEY